jgi:cyclase
MLATGAAAISLPRTAFGADPPAAKIEVSKLTDTVTQITGAGSNVVLLSGPDGVVLIDGGMRGRDAELMKVVSELSKGSRVQALFNTHWHAEHTGLNETLGKTGTKIIAHENTKLWLTQEVFIEWQNRTYKPLPAPALPNQTFYTTGKMAFGDEEIQYGIMPQAHTDGDIYVYLPKSNILVTGDVVSVGEYPVLDYTSGGWIGGMLDATKTLLKVSNANTRIIPGTGPVLGRADLEAQQEMLTKVRESLVKMIRTGYGATDMVAANPTKEFDAKWGNPELFVMNAYRGMWGHVRELGGIV